MDPSSTSTVKRHMARLQPLPQVLGLLTRTFIRLVIPLDVDFEIVWALIYINLKVSNLIQELERVTNISVIIRITGQTQENLGFTEQDP